MKNVNFIIYFGLIFSSVACSTQDNSEELTPLIASHKEKKSKQKLNLLDGKWELSDIDFSDYYATLSAETRKRLEMEMEAQLTLLEGNSTYTFKNANQLLIESPSETGGMVKSVGTYRLSKDQDSVYFMLDDEVETYHVEVLNEHTLVLKTKDTPNRQLTLLR